MAQNKTRPGDEDVAAFIAEVTPQFRREDARTLLALFAEVTGWGAQLWGGKIVGFGRYEYRYASGRGGEFMVTGFSPRTSYMSLYIMPGYQDMSDQLSRLGKHKAGKSCININKLEDVDLEVVREIVTRGVAQMKEIYPVLER